MGLKSGSRDAGLDDADDADEGEESRARSDDATADGDSSRRDAGSSGDANGAGEAGDTDADGPGGSDGAADGRPTVRSLPYTLRRETVNEGRSQVPFFLRDEVVDGEADLQDALEGMLGEEVYKSDYREAGMVVAQRNPELVAEVLREWGYDLQEG